MKFKISTSIVLLLLSLSAHSEMISGIVSDSSTGRPIDRVLVKVASSPACSTFSDANGNFVLFVPSTAAVPPDIRSDKKASVRIIGSIMQIDGIKGPGRINLCDYRGKLVFQRIVKTLSSTIAIMLPRMTPGFYSLKFTASEPAAAGFQLLYVNSGHFHSFASMPAGARRSSSRASAVSTARTNQVTFSKQGFKDTVLSLEGDVCGLLVNMQAVKKQLVFNAD